MELDGKLSRFVLLSLPHHKGQNVVLLLLRPLLPLWHLVLLGLAYQKERNLILLGNMQLLGPLLDLRHLVLLPWFMLLSLLLHL